MRYFLLLGGFIGFASVLVASFYAGNRPALALRDAAIGCVVGGMLFRILHSAFIAGLKARLQERAKLEASLAGDHEDGNPRVS